MFCLFTCRLVERIIQYAATPFFPNPIFHQGRHTLNKSKMKLWYDQPRSKKKSIMIQYPIHTLFCIPYSLFCDFSPFTMSYEIKVAFHPYVTMLRYYFQTKEKIRDTLFTFELNSVDLSSFWRIFCLISNSENSWNFVYVQATRCKTPFFLTDFCFKFFASGITK